MPRRFPWSSPTSTRSPYGVAVGVVGRVGWRSCRPRIVFDNVGSGLGSGVSESVLGRPCSARVAPTVALRCFEARRRARRGFAVAGGICANVRVGISSRTRPGVSEQFQDVVTQAHHGPLGIDASDAAQGKLPESPSVLDLAVDGLDDSLTARVTGSTLGGVESPAHPLARVEVIGRVAGTRGRSAISMTDSSGRHPCLGAQRPRLRLDLGVPIPRIASRFSGTHPTLALTRWSIGLKFAASEGWSVTPESRYAWSCVHG